MEQLLQTEALNLTMTPRGSTTPESIEVGLRDY